MLTNYDEQIYDDVTIHEFFSLPDHKGVRTIIAAGEGHKPKPVVKFTKDLQACRG